MVLAESFNTSFQNALLALKSRIQGEVVLPGGDSYDAARLTWNRQYSHFPEVIVRANDASDVARAVTFAREEGLPISVRGGGHSLAGFGSNTGGVVIDLSLMKRILIDPATGQTWAQGGVTAGELTEATQAHGYVVPMGDSGTVGIGGLTTGGGIGWLARKYGLTIDSLESVEMVTADGQLIHANKDKHSDLFWAVRGGGGNFGIVTSFQFQARPLDLIVGGAMIFELEAETLRRYVDIVSEAPEELTSIAFIMQAPPLPFLAPEHYGKPVLIAAPCYAGDLEEGMKAVAPLRQAGTVLADVVGPMPYAGLYELTAVGSIPHRSKTRMMFTSNIDDTVVESIVTSMSEVTSPLSMIQVRVLGGAASRVEASETAFAHRDKEYFVAVIAGWEDPETDETHHAWVAEAWNRIGGKAEGVYVNFLQDDGEMRIREAYPTETYRRLAAVKAKYDPDNVFAKNQNIRPARAD